MPAQHFSLGASNENEEKPLQFLIDNLPDNFSVFSNGTFRKGSNEIDAIVVGPQAIYVLEFKNYHGKITGDSKNWYISGRQEPSPIGTARWKAQNLASDLKLYNHALGKIFVQPLVFMTGDDDVSRVNDNAKHRIVTHQTVIDYIIHPSPRHMETNARLVNVKPYYPLLEEGLTAGLLVDLPNHIREYTVQSVLWKTSEYTAVKATRQKYPNTRILRIYDFGKQILSKESIYQYRDRFTRDKQALGTLTESITSESDGHEVVLSVDEPFHWIIPDTQRTLFVCPMKYVEANPLRDEFAKEGEVEFWLSCSIASQLCRGLAFIHRSGVRHRNLHPGNILLEEKNKLVHIHNFDHGKISNSFDTIKDSPVLFDLKLNEEVYQKRYRAPELTSDKQQIDWNAFSTGGEYADLYSLGVILHDLFIHPIDFNEPVDHERLPDSLSEKTRQFIKQCLSHTLADRKQMNLQEVAREFSLLADINNGGIIPDLAAGTPILKKYTIDCLLKRTNMSVTYKALNNLANVNVVIKFLNTPNQEQASREIRHSYQLLSQLDRKLCAQWIDCGTVLVEQGKILPDGSSAGHVIYYIVQEYIDGLTLHEFIQSVSMRGESKLEFTHNLISAVAAVYNVGYTHRDIKPANFIVPKDGKLKIIDFGMSRTTAEASGMEGHSPGYTPPEVRKGGDWTPMGDVWSTARSVLAIFCGEREDDLNGPKILWENIQAMDWPEFETFLRDNTQDDPLLRDQNAQKMLERFDVITAQRKCQKIWQELAGKSADEVTKALSNTIKQAAQLVQMYPENQAAQALLEETRQRFKATQPAPVLEPLQPAKAVQDELPQGADSEPAAEEPQLIEKLQQLEKPQPEVEPVQPETAPEPPEETDSGTPGSPDLGDSPRLHRRNSLHSSLEKFEAMAGQYTGRDIPFEVLDKDLLEIWRSITAQIAILPFNDNQALQLRENTNKVRATLAEIVLKGFRRLIAQVEAALTLPEFDTAFQEAGQWAGVYSLVGMPALEAQSQLERAGRRFEVWGKVQTLFDEEMDIINQPGAVERASELRAEIERRLEQIGIHLRTMENQLTSPLGDEVEDARVKRVEDLDAEIRNHSVTQKILARVSFERSIAQGDNYAAQKEAIESLKRLGIFEVEYFESTDSDINRRNRMAVEEALRILEVRWTTWAGGKLDEYTRELTKYHLSENGPFQQNPETLLSELQELVTHINRPIASLDPGHITGYNNTLLLLQRMQNNFLPLKQRIEKAGSAQTDLLATLATLDKIWQEIGSRVPVLETSYQQQRTILIKAIPESLLKDEAAKFKALFPVDPVQAAKLAAGMEKRLAGYSDFQDGREIFRGFSEICEEYENSIKNVEKFAPADSLNVLKDLRQHIQTQGLEEPANLANLIVQYEAANTPFETSKSLVDALVKLLTGLQAEIAGANITFEAIDKVNAALTEIGEVLTVLGKPEIKTIPNVAVLHSKLLTLQRRLQVFQLYLQAWLELHKTSSADLKTAGEDLAKLKNLQAGSAVKDISAAQITLLEQLLAGFLANDQGIENAIADVERKLAAHTSDTLEALPNLLNLWNDLSGKMNLPTSLVNNRAETFEKLRSRLSSLAKRLIVTINQNPRQCNQSIVEETLKWSRGQQIIQENELNQMEGALQEVRAWNYLHPQTVDGKQAQALNLKAAYACWKKAETLQRLNAKEHRLAILKIRAFVEADEGDTRPLREALADPVLKDDEQLITLGAQVRLKVAIKKYGELRYLRGIDAKTVEIDGIKVISFAELDHILTDLQNDLGMQGPGTQTAQGEDGAFLHIWHDLRYDELLRTLYPNIFKSAHVIQEILFRQSVYLDLVALFSLVHETATLSELHHGCTTIAPQMMSADRSQYRELFTAMPHLETLFQEKWQAGRSQVIQGLTVEEYPHKNDFRKMIIDPDYYLAYESAGQQITRNRLQNLNTDLSSAIAHFRQQYVRYSSQGYITALRDADSIHHHWENVTALKESVEDLDKVINVYIHSYASIPNSITNAWDTMGGNPLSTRQAELNNLINDPAIVGFRSDLGNLRQFYIDLRTNENQCYVVDASGKRAITNLENRWAGICMNIVNDLRQHPAYKEIDIVLAKITKLRSDVEVQLNDIRDAHWIDQQDGIHLASPASLKHFGEYQALITAASPVEWAYSVLTNLKGLEDGEKTCWETIVRYADFRGIHDVEDYLVDEVMQIQANRKMLESIQDATDSWSTVLAAGQAAAPQISHAPLPKALDMALLSNDLSTYKYSSYVLQADWEGAYAAFCLMLGLTANSQTDETGQPMQSIHARLNQLASFLQSLNNWEAVAGLFQAMDQSGGQQAISVGKDGLSIALASTNTGTLFGWLRSIYDDMRQIEKQNLAQNSASTPLSQSRKALLAHQQKRLQLTLYKIQIAHSVLTKLQARKLAHENAKQNITELHTRLTIILNKPWWQAGGGTKARQEEASKKLQDAICEYCAIAPLDRTQREHFRMECQNIDNPREKCRRFRDGWGDI